MKQYVIVFTCLRLGDFVWATSAISLVKMFDKNINLTLVMQDSFVSLVDKKLQVDKIRKIKNKYWNNKSKFIRIGYKIFWCLKNYFKYYKVNKFIFLDQFLFLSVILKKFTFVKKIIGPNTFVFGKNIINKDIKYYTNIIKMPSDSDRIHMLIRYQLIVRAVFPTYNLNIPILPKTKYLKDNINSLIKTNKKHRVALCLCSIDKQRDWNIKNFKYIIENLHNVFDVTFFIIGSGYYSLKQANSLINSINNNIDIRNLTNETNLLELKELLDNIDLLIAVDTGVNHIASTTKINIISLFGASLPEHSSPVSSKAISICLYEDCSPCYYNISKGILCNNTKCMEKIKPDTIFEKAKQILKYKENNV